VKELQNSYFQAVDTVLSQSTDSEMKILIESGNAKRTFSEHQGPVTSDSTDSTSSDSTSLAFIVNNQLGDVITSSQDQK